MLIQILLRKQVNIISSKEIIFKNVFDLKDVSCKTVIFCNVYSYTYCSNISDNTWYAAALVVKAIKSVILHA